MQTDNRILHAAFKLVELRKSKGYTQERLGSLVAQLLGTKVSGPYAQKKVSYWESGQAKPNQREIATLADIFGIGIDTVESFFSTLTPLSAADIFAQLGSSKTSSLVAACYNGKPRATLIKDVRTALLNALNHQVCFSMFFPYPLKLQSSMQSRHFKDLLAIYGEIWDSVERHYKDLRSSLDRPRRKQIALYRPSLGGRSTNILVPPSSNRYTLVTESSGESEFASTLYSWVEAENLDGLFRVGTFSIQQAVPQVKAWQAYFGQVLVHWKRSNSLVSRDEYWQRV